MYFVSGLCVSVLISNLCGLQILALGDAIEDKRLEQRRAANLLSCATRLLNLLLKLWLELTDKEMGVLENCLTPVITESEEQVDRIPLLRLGVKVHDNATDLWILHS